MPYWIHDNGETLGPMRAIDVLRRAQSTTRVCDGQTWFWLEEGPDMSEQRLPDSESVESQQTGARVTIR